MVALGASQEASSGKTTSMLRLGNEREVGRYKLSLQISWDVRKMGVWIEPADGRAKAIGDPGLDLCRGQFREDHKGLLL